MRYVSIGFAAIFICFATASAQQPTIQLQDLWVSRVAQGGDTLPASRFAAAYYLNVPNDTTITHYVFSECRKNGQNLYLENWVVGQRTDSLDLTSFNTKNRTRNFAMSTGDTISFYREMAWYATSTNVQTPNNFYSPDTIDYAVELVKSNGTRIALLDSIGVLRRTTLGSPILYGTRPIQAVVRYGVTAINNGDSAFVRVLTYLRGSGSYDPMRLTAFTVGISRRLTNPHWVDTLDYLDLYGGGLGKRTIGRPEAALQGHFSVAPTPSSGDVTLEFPAPSGGGAVTVAIYDVAGRLVLIPYMTSWTSDVNTANVALETPGEYFVTLYHNRIPVATKQIIIR